MPVWGTCLGMQNLAQFASADPDNVLDLYAFDSSDVNYTLEFVASP